MYEKLTKQTSALPQFFVWRVHRPEKMTSETCFQFCKTNTLVPSIRNWHIHIIHKLNEKLIT